jgi:uncharacterized membrane protein
VSTKVSNLRFAGLRAAPENSTLSAPGATRTVAIGVNNPGLIVGEFVTSTDGPHGFLYNGTTYSSSSIDFPAAAFTIAEGINDSGRIGRFSMDAGSAFHGFVLDGGVYAPLDVHGATRTQAFAINNAGQITGYSEDANGRGRGLLATPEPSSRLLPDWPWQEFSRGDDSPHVSSETNEKQIQMPVQPSFLPPCRCNRARLGLTRVS